VYSYLSAKMPSPQRHFASIPELLACVAKDVINRRSLLNLCLTSRFFNAICTPILYTEIWSRENNFRFLVEDLQLLLKNDALKYVQSLDISSPNEYCEGALTQLYNEGVQAFLARLPMLLSFRYV
jgi:hypothetical protein